MPAIEAKGIRKSFGKHPVLAGVDLAVNAGEILCLLGKNGAGKTTMIRILSTLLRPDAGEARILGVDVLKEPQKARAQFRLTGQRAAVDEMLTGRENLALMARLLRLPKPKAVADGLLDRFGLASAAGKRAGAYSSGMRRRLDLAMGLIGNPRALFMDEPTTGLDPHSRRALWDTVRALKEEGTAILLTTQYIEEADMLADRVSVLLGGVIATQGTARELKSQFIRGEIVVEFRSDAARAAAGEGLAGYELRGEGPRLTILTDGSAAGTGAALTSLEGADIVSFEIARPTLEDAFLNIVGQV